MAYLRENMYYMSGPTVAQSLQVGPIPLGTNLTIL